MDWALRLNASRSDGVLMLQLQLAGGRLSGTALRSLHRLEPKPDWQPKLWSNARALQLGSERALVIHRDGDLLWFDQARLAREINQDMASSDPAFSDPGGNLTPRIPIAVDLGADGRLLVVTRRPISYTTQAHSKAFLRVAQQWQCVPVPLHAYTAGALLPDNRVSLGEQHGRVLRQTADGWSESRPFESSAVLALRVSGDYLYAIAEDGRIAVQPCAGAEEWRTVYAGNREIVSAVPLEDGALLVLDASGGLHKLDSHQAQGVAIDRHNNGAETLRPLEVFKWGELLVAAFAADATLLLYRVDGLEAKLQASANVEALPGKGRAIRVVPYAADRAIVFDDATLDRQIFDRQLVINLTGEVVGEFSVNRALDAAMAQVHRERREARARAEREGKKFDIIALMDAQAGRAVEIEALRGED